MAAGIYIATRRRTLAVDRTCHRAPLRAGQRFLYARSADAVNWTVRQALAMAACVGQTFLRAAKINSSAVFANVCRRPTSSSPTSPRRVTNSPWSPAPASTRAAASTAAARPASTTPRMTPPPRSALFLPPPPLLSPSPACCCARGPDIRPVPGVRGPPASLRADGARAPHRARSSACGPTRSTLATAARPRKSRCTTTLRCCSVRCGPRRRARRCTSLLALGCCCRSWPSPHGLLARV